MYEQRIQNMRISTLELAIRSGLLRTYHRLPPILHVVQIRGTQSVSLFNQNDLGSAAGPTSQ
jgi:hypothetical protein